jgi:outer membrane protein assembly factor BamB
MKLPVSFRFLTILAMILIPLMQPLPAVSARVDNLTIRSDAPSQDNSPEGQDAGANKVYLPSVSAPGSTTSGEPSWPMVAANLERTSWTPTEVRGTLHPRWYKPIEPYIPPKVQVIASDNTLFISTARGLYALDATTGFEKWVFPTELPLGNSPTVNNGIVYVGGTDRNLYAINASSGQKIWSYQAGAGFDTNPVVAGDKVYAGNRDGIFYAIYNNGVNRGKLAWSFLTEQAIHLSAAYKDGILYFASDDMHAYALNAQNGALVWKSGKLPGTGSVSYTHLTLPTN